MPGVGWKLGIAPGIGINYHNSAIQQLPNGDFLAAYYNNQQNEDDPDQTVLIMRRRAGAEAWDMPNPSPCSPMPASARRYLERQSASRQGVDVLRLLAPHRRATLRLHDLDGQWRNLVAGQCSPLPQTHRPLRLAAHQLHRPRQGWHHLHPHRLHRQGSDGNGSISAVWATKDEGKTWYDTGGRTAGRHTTIVFAKNGDLLGFGGKNSNIDGRMPLATSPDDGKTWIKSKTPFDPLASGQRPSVIRLASGRLFFVGDHNPPKGRHRFTDGAYVALSDDDGKNWTIKNLPPDVGTVGYTTSTQDPTAPSTSSPPRTHPTTRSKSTKPGCWTRMQALTLRPQIPSRMRNTLPSAIPAAQRRWQPGALAALRTDATLLDGPEKFYYPDGKLMWSHQLQRWTKGRRRRISSRRRNARVEEAVCQRRHLDVG